MICGEFCSYLARLDLLRNIYWFTLVSTLRQNLIVRNCSSLRCKSTRKIQRRCRPSRPFACLSKGPTRRRRSLKTHGCHGRTWTQVCPTSSARASSKPSPLDDPKLPPISSRLNLTRIFLELSLFTPALMVLQGIMASDDEEVEAWYLEGWCFFLMAEQARERGGKLDELAWEELARDSRDCLETCKTVRSLDPSCDLCTHFLYSSYMSTKGILTFLYENMSRSSYPSWMSWA